MLDCSRKMNGISRQMWNNPARRRGQKSGRVRVYGVGAVLAIYGDSSGARGKLTGGGSSDREEVARHGSTRARDYVQRSCARGGRAIDVVQYGCRKGGLGPEDPRR